MTFDAPREALLADARRRAEEILAEAEREAREQVEPAREQAEELVAEARRRGESEGRGEAAREESARRFGCHVRVLAAQRASHDELRRRVRAAALALREEPGYRELLERLAASVRGELGEDAQLELDPSERGGVLGRSGSRSVDYTLETLADRCTDGLGARLAALWS